jgi:hypothetical protein
VQLRPYMDTEVFIYGPVMRGHFLKRKGGEANCLLHWIAVSDILEIKFSAQGCLGGKKRELETQNMAYRIVNISMDGNNMQVACKIIDFQYFHL